MYQCQNDYNGTEQLDWGSGEDGTIWRIDKCTDLNQPGEKIARTNTRYKANNIKDST